MTDAQEKKAVAKHVASASFSTQSRDTGKSFLRGESGDVGGELTYSSFSSGRGGVGWAAAHVAQRKAKAMGPADAAALAAVVHAGKSPGAIARAERALELRNRRLWRGVAAAAIKEAEEEKASSKKAKLDEAVAAAASKRDAAMVAAPPIAHDRTTPHDARHLERAEAGAHSAMQRLNARFLPADVGSERETWEEDDDDEEKEGRSMEEHADGMQRDSVGGGGGGGGDQVDIAQTPLQTPADLGRAESNNAVDEKSTGEAAPGGEAVSTEAVDEVASEAADEVAAAVSEFVANCISAASEAGTWTSFEEEADAVAVAHAAEKDATIKRLTDGADTMSATPSPMLMRPIPSSSTAEIDARSAVDGSVEEDGGYGSAASAQASLVEGSLVEESVAESLEGEASVAASRRHSLTSTPTAEIVHSEFEVRSEAEVRGDLMRSDDTWSSDNDAETLGRDELEEEANEEEAVQDAAVGDRFGTSFGAAGEAGAEHRGEGSDALSSGAAALKLQAVQRGKMARKYAAEERKRGGEDQEEGWEGQHGSMGKGVAMDDFFAATGGELIDSAASLADAAGMHDFFAPPTINHEEASEADGDTPNKDPTSGVGAVPSLSPTCVGAALAKGGGGARIQYGTSLYHRGRSAGRRGPSPSSGWQAPAPMPRPASAACLRMLTPSSIGAGGVGGNGGGGVGGNGGGGVRDAIRVPRKPRLSSSTSASHLPPHRRTAAWSHCVNSGLSTTALGSMAPLRQDEKRAALEGRPSPLALGDATTLGLIQRLLLPLDALRADGSNRLPEYGEAVSGGAAGAKPRDTKNEMSRHMATWRPRPQSALPAPLPMRARLGSAHPLLHAAATESHGGGIACDHAPDDAKTHTTGGFGHTHMLGPVAHYHRPSGGLARGSSAPPRYSSSRESLSQFANFAALRPDSPCSSEMLHRVADTYGVPAESSAGTTAAEDAEWRATSTQGKGNNGGSTMNPGGSQRSNRARAAGAAQDRIRPTRPRSPKQWRDFQQQTMEVWMRRWHPKGWWPPGQGQVEG